MMLACGAEPSIRCDLFCAVVDHFGDAGVCWRLARALTARGWQVRMWIDDPEPLRALAPGAQPGTTWQGVHIEHWREGGLQEVEVADVVIEAFACELPAAYLGAMAARVPAPLWLNLEYLSAEAWVDACHGLPSPHPRLPLVKHFFFPGFTPATGGLLGDFAGDAEVCSEDAALTVSLFCYDNDQLPDLLDAWAADRQGVHCRVCAGGPARQVEHWLGAPLVIGRPVQRGGVQLQALPFLPQEDYDRLLTRCALNFVRGEDSFVRAQWAARPLIWQAYPQADGAHFAKLDAFLGRYCVGLDATPAQVLRRFNGIWNGRGGPLDWPALRTALPALAGHAAHWSATLRAAGDLADKLVSFCRAKLKSRPFFQQAEAR